MTATIIERFTEALDAAIAERGEDYHYVAPAETGECAYAVDGAPSCGVGYAIEKLDHEYFEQVAQFEADTGTFGAATLVNPPEWSWTAPPALPGVEKLGDSERKTFARAVEGFQSVQDTGYSWGAAREVYQRVLAGEHITPYLWPAENGYKKTDVAAAYDAAHPEDYEEDYA